MQDYITCKYGNLRKKNVIKVLQHYLGVDVINDTHLKSVSFSNIESTTHLLYNNKILGAFKCETSYINNSIIMSEIFKWNKEL